MREGGKEEEMVAYAEAGHEDVDIFLLVRRGWFSLVGRLSGDGSHCSCHLWYTRRSQSCSHVD